MAIREILLHFSVLAITCAGLINPVFGLFGYMWFSLARPDSTAWVEGQYPHSMILAIVTLLGAWRYLPNLSNWMRNPWVVSLLLLQVPMILSVFNAQNFALAWIPYKSFAKYLLISLLIPLFITELKEYRRLMLVVAFSIGLIGFRFGLFGLRTGGVHITSGLGGFMSDNNTLALAFNMGIPFIWHSRALVHRTWQKAAIHIAMFTTIIGILITHSRAGILALGLVILLLIFRSKHKLAVLMLAALMSLPGVYMMADSLASRMQTLEHVEQDGSAAARLNYARIALEVWKEYPVLGVGFGTLNWTALSEKYLYRSTNLQVVHNNYLQMAVDSGTFALVILLWQIFHGIYWTGKSARLMKRIRPDLVAYPYALEGSLAAFALGSMFMSRTDYDFYYYVVMMVGAWYTVQQRVVAAHAQATAEAALASPPPTAVPETVTARPQPGFVPRFRSASSPIRTSTRIGGS